MYKIFTKLFLWYSKKLGYEVSITRELRNSYEYYTNNTINNSIASEKLEVPTPSYIQPNPNIIIGQKIEDQFRPNRFYKTNSKVSLLDLKMVHTAGGVATLMAKKVNELVNAVNLINFHNNNPQE